jgi:putative transcriptional regulator
LRLKQGDTPADVGIGSATSRLQARLLLFRPRFTLPVHRHAGAEHTLVLAGGFTDGAQHYERGDVASPHPEDWHAPRVDDNGPCLALVVNDGPIVVSSLAQRLLLALVDV